MIIDSTNYAYAVGRVRALETRLLDRARFERMIEAQSAEEALKILTETDYAGAIGELKDVHDFETLLTAELVYTFELVKDISPYPEFISILSLRYDIHNLKVILKAKYLGVKSDLLIPLGTLKPELLEYAVNEEDYRDLPQPIRSAVENINEEFFSNRDPQTIDLLLDQVLFKALLQEADKYKSNFLKQFFIRQIDLINLKTVIRVKRMGLNREFLKKVYLSDGSIPLDRFLAAFEEPLESLITALSMTDYAGLMEEGIRNWQDKGTASTLEKMADDYITEFFRQKKWTPFGLEPLIGYLWAKEIEIKNIRLILVGKINKLPAEAIRERIRNVYI